MTLQPTGPFASLPRGVGLALLGSLVAHAALLSVTLSQSEPGGSAATSRSLSLQVVRAPAVTRAAPMAASSQPHAIPLPSEPTAAGAEPQRAEVEPVKPVQKQLAVAHKPVTKTTRTPVTRRPLPQKKEQVARASREKPKATPEAAAIQAQARPVEQPKRPTTATASFSPSASRPAARSTTTNKSRQTDNQPRQLASLLQGSLSRHFRYPSMARRRGYQGTVTLRLRVQRNGLIEQIEVAQGSGYGILDRDALKTLKRIGRVPLQQLVLSETVELTLPVVYRLTSG